MLFIFIQVVINLFAFWYLSKRHLMKYMRFSYFLFPVIYFFYVTRVGGFIDSGFKGITLDITSLSSLQFYIIIAVVNLIQITFGRYRFIICNKSN